MQTSQSPVWARDHTLLGVCEALGEDLGFSPVLLRIAFAAGLFFSPAGALAVYAGLGLLVAVTRLLSPDPCPVALDRAPADQASARVGDNDDRDIAIAA